MAKDRNVACIYYEAEGCCKKKREGTFYHYCQKCDRYDPIKGGKSARVNNKRKKLDKIKRKDCE